MAYPHDSAEQTPTAPPGWYPDGSGMQRYWDGHAWTEHVAPIAGQSGQPSAQPGARPFSPIWYAPAAAPGATTPPGNLAPRPLPVGQGRGVGNFDERTSAKLVHLFGLFLPFLGAFVFFVLAHRNRASEFVIDHVTAALNFQITVVGVGVVTSYFMGLGAAAVTMFGLVSIVLSIKGAICASRGEWYRYALSLRPINKNTPLPPFIQPR